MKKIQSTLPNIVMSLTIICFASGVTLSAVNRFTEHIIAETRLTELRNAIRNVTPEFDNDPVAEQFKAAVTAGDSLSVFPAKLGGVWVGSAVESHSKNGFSGQIRVLVGFDDKNHIINYSVLEHNETPGLGSKMEEWFRRDPSRHNIIGRDMSNKILQTTKDGGDVDAITGSTITTRAFLEAINLAFAVFSGYEDAVSGATGK